MKIEPFRIHVPDHVLEDLRLRLGRSRLPDAIEGAGWDYGFDVGFRPLRGRAR